MPKLPMPPTNDEAYQRNTKEQYEMLGRFVEAFELMVHEVRELCLFLAARDGRNAALVETILHHQALSAKPLFEILRALVAEALKDTLKALEDLTIPLHDVDPPLLADADGNPLPLTIKDRDTFFGILAFINGKYETLANQRNDLLHGTWFVGYVSNDNPDSSEFLIRRLRTSKRGLSPVTGLPKTAAELKTLADQCKDVRYWLGYVEQCLQGWTNINEVFACSGKTWWLIIYLGNKTTLQ
jgi:hypothetical protein